MHKSVKPLIALVLTGIGSALVFGFKTSDAALPATAKTPSTTSSTTASGSGTGTSTSTTKTRTTTATAAPAPTSASRSQYADGTYAGAAVSEPWGTFEVEAVIKGGKLTDVKLVAAPSDRHSNQINNVAVPLLTQSALAAQSANIDLVSGATWTSESYAESLQSALDAAAAAGQTLQTVA